MQQILAWKEITLSFSMISNQCTQQTLLQISDVQILRSSLPQTHQHYDSEHLYATDGLTSQAHTTIYPAYRAGGNHSTHLSWELTRKNPNSPWEGLISAGVHSSSTTPGAEGAKKNPWVWEKEGVFSKSWLGTARSFSSLIFPRLGHF